MVVIIIPAAGARMAEGAELELGYSVRSQGSAARVVMEGTAHAGGMEALAGSGSGRGGCAVGGGGGGGGNSTEVAAATDRLVAEVVPLLRPHCPASC